MTLHIGQLYVYTAAMAYIFMDESGDLGFDFTKVKTSRHFVVTFLLMPDEGTVRAARKIVKKVVRTMSKRGRRKHTGVLHAHKESPAIRRRLLAEVAKLDIGIFTIVLNKQRVYVQSCSYRMRSKYCITM
jgi:hypothetical protein